MPIRTIADLASAANTNDNSPQVRPAAAEASLKHAVATTAAASSGGPPLPFVCCHIPTLKSPDQARDMLFRIAREFHPIICRRNYNVISISEMCCCGDGLDHEPTTAGKKRRKRRIMGGNILGYNMTTSNTSGRSFSRIHIRFRHHADHNRFFDYEDVAGTLAHELAHCVYSKHDAKFFKLMDEILDEHAAIMTSTLRNQGTPMAAFSGNGQRLGSSLFLAPSSFVGNGNRLGGSGGTSDGKNDPRKARGYKLGGDSTFAIFMTPAEAAVAAAEARRRQQQLRIRGDNWCKPCVIDISDDDDNDDPSETGNNHTKPAAKRRTTDNLENQPIRADTTCIDLTIDEALVLLDSKPPAKIESKTHGDASDNGRKWSCRRCTFENGPIALACAMCTTERNYRP